MGFRKILSVPHFIPAGEIGDAGRKFDGAVNIEARGFVGTFPFNSDNFHDTHKSPFLFSKQLRDAVNFDISKIKLDRSLLEPKQVQQDNTRVVSPKAFSAFRQSIEALDATFDINTIHQSLEELPNTNKE
jgi:hypothetical protein